MIRIRKLASALCLALLCIKPLVSNAQPQGILDPTQVYSTPNIVPPVTTSSGSTWVNGVYQDNLSCWSFVDLIFGGYCGPNPIVRPGGSINFSYGNVDLHQIQAVASVLPNSGSGLRVNGFNFGFTAKNGNGWDNGQVDTLSAYTTFYDTSGQVARNYTYDLNYKFGWTTFNFNETFQTPYAAKDLSNVRYGFVGSDNNYWLGPYGPEITNVNFSLKYSVDPCSVNIMSSPTCPGYLEALAKLSPTTTAEVAPVAIAAPTATTAPTSSNTTVESVPAVASTPTTTNNPNASVSTTVNATAVTSVTPSATNPQPKVGEVQTSAPKPTVSTSQMLSIISAEQSRVGGVEKSAVATATEQAATASAKAVSEAETVASLLTNQSVVNSVTSTQTQGIMMVNPSRSTPMQVAPGQGISIAIVSPSLSFSIRSNDTNNSTKQIESSTNNINYNIAAPTFNVFESRNQQTEEFIQKQESVRLQSNPLSSHMNPSPIFPNTTNEQTSMSVKRDVQPNEAAGNIDIASISVIPRGYDAYTNLALRDGSFYKPEEIYKNQKTVDNARVLRGLSGASDMKHQEMVNQQYQKGN